MSNNCVQNTAHNIFQNTADNEWSFCPQYPSTKKGIQRGGGATGVSSGTGGGAGGKTYGQKGYIGDKCYDEMMNRATYSDFLNKFKEKKSQRDKPYLPGDYAEMEHFYPIPSTPPTPSYPNLPGIPGAEDEFWDRPPGIRPDFCDIICRDDRGEAPEFQCTDVLGWCYPALVTLGSALRWIVEGPVKKILKDTESASIHIPLGGIEIHPDWDAIEAEGDVKCATFKAKLTEVFGTSSTQQSIIVENKLECFEEEFELCCKNICECPSDPVFAYTSGNPTTIVRGQTATITVNNGCGAFHWSVAGTGFSFANSSTAAGTNTLLADNTACFGIITVTDNCGDDATGEVRVTAGSWTYKGRSSSDGCTPWTSVEAYDTYTVISAGQKWDILGKPTFGTFKCCGGSNPNPDCSWSLCANCVAPPCGDACACCVSAGCNTCGGGTTTVAAGFDYYVWECT